MIQSSIIYYYYYHILILFYFSLYNDIYNYLFLNKTVKYKWIFKKYTCLYTFYNTFFNTERVHEKTFQRINSRFFFHFRLPSPYNKQSSGVGSTGGGPGGGTSIPLPATVAATRRCPPDKVRPAPAPTHQSQLGKFHQLISLTLLWRKLFASRACLTNKFKTLLLLRYSINYTRI